jgi:hypothetical protein
MPDLRELGSNAGPTRIGSCVSTLENYKKNNNIYTINNTFLILILSIIIKIIIFIAQIIVFLILILSIIIKIIIFIAQIIVFLILIPSIIIK